MAVGPAQRGLQDQVQTVEAYIERHLQAPHDSRLDIVESDLQARDRWGGCHAASLTARLVQFQGSNASRSRMGCSLMRASTSASQACGSTSLSLAVMISIAIAAARSAPRSDPASWRTLRRSAAEQPLMTRSISNRASMRLTA